jgi:TonB family protein
MQLIYKKSDTFMDVGPKTGSLPKEKRRKILKSVTIVHLSLVLIPCLWYAISYFFIPKKSVITVTLVPPSASSPQSSYIPPAPDHSQKQKKNKPPKRVPPKKITHTKRVHRKKQVTKKAPVRKSKPKWQPKKSNEITISKKIISNNNTSSRQQHSVHRVSAKDIESKLRKVYQHNSNRSPVQATQGNVSSNYRDKLYTAIYRLWDQPARSELGGKYPIVDITLTVESSGRVSSARISQKSGVRAMDVSVSRLLQKLKQLPPPSAGRMSFTVSLEIVD